MRRVLIILFFIALKQEVAAQEMWGISNSNFAGNMGMALNPATMVAAPYAFEINLISADVFLQNNYIFVKRRSSLLAKSVQGEAVSDDRIRDNYTSALKNGYAQVFLKGPSLLINRGNIAFGFHTAMRIGFSGRSIERHLAKFMYEGFNYQPQHGIQYQSGPFKATLLQWAEAGISVGGVLNEQSNSLLTGALTLKYLLPMNAVFIDVESVDYRVPDSKLLIVDELTGTYGHTAFDNNGNIPGQIFSIKGQGVGADLGISLIRGRLERAYECGKRGNGFKKYKYKIGFSLIDLGYSRLSGGSTEFSIQNKSMQWPGIDSVKFDNLAGFDSSLSHHFFNDPEASRSGNGFSVFLPAALSLQFDYCIAPRWYVNASVIQRIPVGKRRILRPNQVSVTPRYETRHFEIALPFSLYDYTQPRFGLAFRYRFFVLGTDKLGAFTGLWNISGADIYFGLKFSGCSKTRKKNRSGGCYEF